MEENLISSSALSPLIQGDAGDINNIKNIKDFWKEFKIESKKLWLLAGPAIFTYICQYSLGAITQTFAGQVGTRELAAVSVVNSVIAGFSFGVMLGMGSALETLCGQAYGAGQLDMMGIYMQRSWIILFTTSLLLSFLYIFAGPILRLIGQTDSISDSAGLFSIYMIPQLFAYSLNFPIAKFLQAQSKMMVMAAISAAALVLHTFFSWLLMLKLKWGLVGAAVVFNSSCWFIAVAQLVYIFGGACGRAWSGFSWMAFHNLWGFVRLSLASAIMLCLEEWYFMALILFAGYLKNAEISVDGCQYGVAIGAGWQEAVAYVNIGCYYIFGIPLGLTLGYKLNLGVVGIWYGMLSGTVVQTLILFLMTYRTDWNKEASIAEDRIRTWGGEVDARDNEIVK